jgi:glycosyltransferase involved in cell wall biosynthesis
LCESLAYAGVDVHVYTTTANGNAELQAQKDCLVEGVKVSYFKRLTKDHSHFSPTLLNHLYKTASRFDVIHIHSWWNLVSIFALIICIARGRKVVVSPRGMLSAYTLQARVKKAFHYFFGKPLFRRVWFHATGMPEKEEIEGLKTGKSVRVIPNILKLQFVAPSSQPWENIKLLFLSRIHPKKGLDLLLPVLKDLPGNWELTIAGEGDEQYKQVLKMKAEKLGISGKISWAGHLSSEVKWPVLAEHDLLILPSQNENFANIVIESLAVGTPVLISNKVGVADFVAEQQLGWVCELNKESLKTNLIEAYESQDRRNKIRAVAPEIVKDHFSTEILIKQYLELYSLCKRA